MTSVEFKWLIKHASNLSKYAGKHIAIVGNRVVGVGETFIQAFEQAKKKYPDREPLVTFVPRKKSLMYYEN